MKYISLLLLVLSMSSAAYAEDAATPATQTAYVSLTPALVGNYGAGRKLKYYKADIALRVQAEHVASVEYHEPLIRDQLIQLFAQQSDENMQGAEGKEAVRKAALEQVRQVLNQEEGQPLVEDLLFNNLVVQP